MPSVIVVAALLGAWLYTPPEYRDCTPPPGYREVWLSSDAVQAKCRAHLGAQRGGYGGCYVRSLNTSFIARGSTDAYRRALRIHERAHACGYRHN